MGLDTDLEPWILPQDAFSEIENGHIHHGYVEKREGYQIFGDMVHGREITAATAANPAVFTVTSATNLNNGDTVTLHYLSGGNWANLNGVEYTISGLVGTSFSLLDSTGTLVDGSSLGVYLASTGRLGIYPRERIMGIFRYIGADNTRFLLISDTKRVAIYNATTEIFEPLDLYDSTGTLQTNSDVWSSTDTDYITYANWQNPNLKNRVYITNGKSAVTGPPGTDGIVYYDSDNPRVEQFRPSLNTTDTLYGCKFLFSIKQRLLCLHTFEFNGASTTTYPQRARWCAGQNPSNWNDSTPGGGGFVDCPTGEQIISAKQLQDIIIVNFTDSVWALKPVSDPALPFRWEKINSFRACDGKMATVGYDRYVVSIGQRGISATDSIETRRIDDRIQDFTTEEINQDNFEKVFGERSYANTRTWILYPKGESIDANAALIYDDESSAFSKYRFRREESSSEVDLNVLGYGSTSKDYAAEDFIEANDLDIAAEDLEDETAFSFFWSSKAELFLGGNRYGEILRLEIGGNDNGESIEFSLESAGWNPFKDQGVEAQLGYVDIYADSNQDTKLSIEFSKNDSETSYVSQGLDLLPNLAYKASCANIVPNSDPSTGFTIYANSHGVSAGDKFYLYGVEGSSFFNDLQFEADSVTENSISVDLDIRSYGIAITGITQANPGVVTAVSHNFNNGDQVYITNVSGMTEVNGNVFTVANKTDDTFELSGVNTTTFTAYTTGGYVFDAYTGGGQIMEQKFYRTKIWKRVYAGGIGYNHIMKVKSEGVNRPLKIHAFKTWFRPVGRVLG